MGGNHHCRSVCGKYHRQTVLTLIEAERKRSLMFKSVAKIDQLVAKGYPRTLLEQIAHSEDFPTVGFSTGDNRKTYYFHLDKLREYLERRERNERS